MIKFIATALAVSVLAAGCFDNAAPTDDKPKEKAMGIIV